MGSRGKAGIADLESQSITKRHIVNLRERIQSSHFIRSVAMLGTGTILSQLIVVAASPILTRLYTPADFGLVALFAAVVGSITPAICGRYEVAVVVAKSVSQSKQLLGIAFLMALGLSMLAFVGVWYCGGLLVRLFNAERLGDWILLAPFALFLAGVLAGMNYYSNRMHEYRVISQSKILAALFGVVASVTFGLLGLHSGLLLSSVIATAAVSLWLLYRYNRILNRSLLLWNRRKRVLLLRYRDFPIYNASTGLLDGVRLALPVFFLSRYFPEAVVGYYALVLRVAMAPISFVSGAVSQVNLKKVADLVHQNQAVRPYLLRVTVMLLFIVSPLLVILILYAPPLFAWAFGEDWRVAGDYLQILMPSLALQFVVSTVSTTFGATGHNRLGAIWKITAFVVTFGVYLVFAPRVDVMGMFVAMMLTDLALYSFYYFLAWHAAGHPLGYR